MKKFKRTKEDFTCENCGFFVVGNGYTNHCPKCLWSKHVDINPGDRLSECGGMMKPIKIEAGKSKYKLTNRCVICGHEKNNTLLDSDNWDEAVKIQKKTAEQSLSNQNNLLRRS